MNPALSGHFSHISLLLKRLGIALLVFTLCRILFYLFNTSFFTGASLGEFFWGIQFDLAAIAMFYSPYIILQLLPIPFRTANWYNRMLKWVFHLINSLAITLNCVDIEYYKFTLKRSTADLLDLIGTGDDLLSLLPAFIMDFWYVLFLIVLLVALSEFLYRRTSRKAMKENLTAGSALIQTGLGFVIITVFVFTARGGFQLRPISIINAGIHTTAENIPLVLNTPFTIIKTFDKQGVEEVAYFDEKELKALFNPVRHFEPTGEFKPLNVVIIIMESLSAEYVGALSNNEGYTPFLDSLIGKGMLFTNCYANGKKSMEGIPAIVASLPTLMNNPYITSPYSGNNINSLASILGQKGYATSFFHGGTNGTMGFDAFAKAAGYDRYFGRYEYNNENHYDGNWGIYDHHFFDYFAKQLGKEQEPFFSTFFSLSSHHPYSVPDKYERKFNEGSMKIHVPTQYADFSLSRFFYDASQSKWFKNTLFVITADHTGPAESQEYKTSTGIYHIPLLYYMPESNLQGRNEKITQQIDVMPTVLDLINYQGDIIAFGKSPFADNPKTFAINFISNVYQIITDRYLLHFDGKESIALYDLINDPLQKKNILKKESKAILNIEQQLKAVIQSYNHRLLSNQLVVK